MGGQHPEKVDAGLFRHGSAAGLVLGGAQIGTAYGICNRAGPQSQDSLQELFASAEESGIHCIDTAPAYGSSESLIGEHLAGNDSFAMISKTDSFAAEESPTSPREQIGQQCRTSLRRLGRDTLAAYLVHRPEELMGPAADEIWRGMEDLRAAGLVEKIGFSAYDGDDLERCVMRFGPDLVQVPISILDQRLIASGSLCRIQDMGIEVHARSVFLQGTILASPESLPVRLTGLAQGSAAVQSLCRDLGIRPIDLALGFVRSLRLVDRVVVGFDTPQQLVDAQAWRPGQLPDLDWSALALSDPGLLNPRNW